MIVKKVMIIDDIKTVVCDWAKMKPRISQVYLFGSRAKGCERVHSDIDLAVVLSEAFDFSAIDFCLENKKRMTNALQALFAVKIDFQFAFDEDGVVMPAIRVNGANSRVG